MTKIDISILAATKSQPNGPTKTSGHVDGGGTFWAYLGQQTATAQSTNPFSTTNAATPQTVELSFAPEDGMVRSPNLELGQIGTDSLTSLEQGANLDQPATSLGAALLPTAGLSLANAANGSAIQADHAMPIGPSAPHSTEAPTLLSINSLASGIATAHLPDATPQGPWFRVPVASKSITNVFQQTGTPDEHPLSARNQGQSHHQPDSLLTSQVAEQKLLRGSQIQALPADNAISALFSSFPSTLPSLHTAKTSELVASNIGESETQLTSGLAKLNASTAINSLDAWPATASPSHVIALGGEPTPADLPAGLAGAASTKAQGSILKPEQAMLAQVIDSKRTSSPSTAEHTQQNKSQIAPQHAQATPATESAQLKPQPASYDTDVNLAPARPTAEPKGSGIAQIQSRDVQVRTILQLPAQQAETIQNTSPKTQSQIKNTGSETVIKNTTLATATNPNTFTAPTDDIADLAQNSEKKSLYGNVFAPTGFSASAASSPAAQAPAIHPTAVPISAIAEQIRTHSTPGKHSAIELTLTPEDLGKIRLVMVPEGDKIRIVVHADRPETLDLIRRNTDSFSADLRQAGYGNASFSFGGWNGRQPSRQDQQGTSNTFESAAEDAAPALTNAKPLASQPKLSGLNLRV